MITGELPACLGNLCMLTNLSFHNNHLIGQIPTSFGNLKNLSLLYLSGNQLVGPIPHQLDQLKVLQTLDLSFNPFGLVPIPTWLSEQNILFQLSLAGTGLRGQLPQCLSSSSVNYLDLSSCTDRLGPPICKL